MFCGVRRAMNIGLERQITVNCWPGVSSDMSMVMGAPAAMTSAAGFI